MADVIEIVTDTPTVVEVGTVGPQGPAGPKGDPGEVAGSVPWGSVTDKPSTFTPSAHTHAISDVTGLQTALDAAGSVDSVNGQTGVVVLDAGDVGAAADNDPRLSDPRDPNAHAASHAADGSDPLEPSDIGLGSSDNVSFNTVYSNGLTLNGDGLGLMFTEPNVGEGAIATSRDALGLGTAATQDSTDFDPSGTAASAVSTHAGKTDGTAHSISGISGLTDALSGKVGTSDARLSDSREWSASTIDQATAEAGTDTTRRAFTALRVFQAVAAWWNGSAAKTKLDGIASGATANSSDATLLARANHTGTQAASTVTGLATIATSGSASDLGSGTVPTARLGSGSASSSTYLRGDQTWATIPASGASINQAIAVGFVLN